MINYYKMKDKKIHIVRTVPNLIENHGNRGKVDTSDTYANNR